MASNEPRKSGGKGSAAKNLKRHKKDEEEEEEENEDLEELMDPEEQKKPKRKASSIYKQMTGFVTRGKDRKERLDQCHKRIVAAAGKPDDDVCVTL